jgi:hypothetical protein
VRRWRRRCAHYGRADHDHDSGADDHRCTGANHHNQGVDAKADYSAYLESRSDADFYAWVKNVGDHMTKMNDAMAPVVKACSNVGQTLTPAKFTHFSSTG